jgi:hypothetical protein
VPTQPQQQPPMQSHHEPLNGHMQELPQHPPHQPVLPPALARSAANARATIPNATNAQSVPSPNTPSAPPPACPPSCPPSPAQSDEPPEEDEATKAAEAVSVPPPAAPAASHAGDSGAGEVSVGSGATDTLEATPDASRVDGAPTPAGAQAETARASEAHAEPRAHESAKASSLTREDGAVNGSVDGAAGDVAGGPAGHVPGGAVSDAADGGADGAADMEAEETVDCAGAGGTRAAEKAVHDVLADELPLANDPTAGSAIDSAMDVADPKSKPEASSPVPQEAGAKCTQKAEASGTATIAKGEAGARSGDAGTPVPQMGTKATVGERAPSQALVPPHVEAEPQSVAPTQAAVAPQPPAAAHAPEAAAAQAPAPAPGLLVARRAYLVASHDIPAMVELTWDPFPSRTGARRMSCVRSEEGEGDPAAAARQRHTCPV